MQREWSAWKLTGDQASQELKYPKTKIFRLRHVETTKLFGEHWHLEIKAVPDTRDSKPGPGMTGAEWFYFEIPNLTGSPNERRFHNTLAYGEVVRVDLYVQKGQAPDIHWLPESSLVYQRTSSQAERVETAKLIVRAAARKLVTPAKLFRVWNSLYFLKNYGDSGNPYDQTPTFISRFCEVYHPLDIYPYSIGKKELVLSPGDLLVIVKDVQNPQAGAVAAVEDYRRGSASVQVLISTPSGIKEGRLPLSTDPPSEPDPLIYAGVCWFTNSFFRVNELRDYLRKALR